VHTLETLRNHLAARIEELRANRSKPLRDELELWLGGTPPFF